MKKRGFTLIELIFVIVVIGVLSAVALPKFIYMKQSAEASSIIKTSFDVVREAVECATDRIDLENQRFGKDFNLTDIVKLNGENWKNGEIKNNSYYYQISNGKTKRNVIKIAMNSHEINLTIYCYNFFDPVMQKKCKELIGGKPGWMSINESFPY